MDSSSVGDGISLTGDRAFGRSGSLRTVFGGAAFLLASAYMLRRTMLSIAPPGSNDGGTLADFRDAIYLPLKALKEGVNPYDTPRYLAKYPEAAQEFPLYSPHLLALFSPFILISLKAARLLHLLLTFCLFPLLISQLSLLARIKVSRALVLSLSAVTVLSLPGRYIVGTGQTTLLLAIGLVLVVSSRSSTILAAFGICLLLTKLVIGLPVLILVLFSGRARAVWWGVAMSVVLTLPVLSRLIVVSGGFDGLIEAFRANLAYRSTLQLSATDLFVDPMSVLARISAADVPVTFQLAWVAVVIGTAAALLCTMPRCLERERLPGFRSVLIPSAVLVSVYQPTYHLILLTVAFAGVLGMLHMERVNRSYHPDGILRGCLWVLLVLGGGVCFNPLLSETMTERFGAPNNLVLRSSNGIGVLLFYLLTILLPVASQQGLRHQWSFANRKKPDCSYCERARRPRTSRLVRLANRRLEQNSFASTSLGETSSRRMAAMLSLERP